LRGCKLTSLFVSVLVIASCSGRTSSTSTVSTTANSGTTATYTPTSTPSNTATNSSPVNQPGKSPIVPDQQLTPGDALDVTRDDICVSGYSKKVRNVPQAVKEQAYREYGIASRQPREYEVDHLISLELGGSNSIKNLWPESFITEPWNAHVKDKLENKLHEMICSRQIDIKAAQREIATDWIAAYKKYVGPEPSANDAHHEQRSARESAASSSTSSGQATGEIIGNKRSQIFHKPGCPDYDKVSPQNRVMFKSVAEAEKAGYHAAKNCP